MKLQIFKFFRGIVSARVVNIADTLNGLNYPQPRRYPRLPNRQMEYPEDYRDYEPRRIFVQGWRACEQGREIYNNPYSNRENLIYQQHEAWERGWLECYHHHPSRSPREIVMPTDEECYQNGWEQAQRGYPLNTNPWNEGTNQYSMFNLGWNDFVNTH